MKNYEMIFLCVWSSGDILYILNSGKAIVSLLLAIDSPWHFWWAELVGSEDDCIDHPVFCSQVMRGNEIKGEGRVDRWLSGAVFNMTS